MHLAVFFVGERGHVDSILDHAALQIFFYLQRDLHSDKLLRLIGGTSDMRCRDHVRRCKQWTIFRRLLCKHIERCASDLPRFERLEKSGVVDQFAASAVHQPHPLFHLRQSSSIDHALGLKIPR